MAQNRRPVRREERYEDSRRTEARRSSASRRSSEPRRSGEPHRKKKKRTSPLAAVGRVLFGLVVALSAVIVVAYGGMKLMAKMPSFGDEPELPPINHGQDGPETPGGPDQTPAPKLERKSKTWTFLLACTDATSGNTDTIMVGMYDTVNQKAGLVSIPRDTLVNATIDGQTYRKINSLYNVSVEALMSEVSKLLGIPIDHYVTVDIKAFIKLVNLVDGIDYNVPVHMWYEDDVQDLLIQFEPGMQHLDGKQTMELCRFRYSNDGSGTELTDAGRNQIQREVLAQIAKKVLSNPQKIASYLELFFQYVKTDLKLEELLWFVEPAMGFDMSTGLTTGGLTGDYDVHYNGQRWYFLPDREESTALINQTVNPYTTDLPADRMRIFQVNG